MLVFKDCGVYDCRVCAEECSCRTSGITCMYIYTVFYSVYIHIYIHTLYILFIYRLLFNITSAGAQVPITSYTCTQPNVHGFQDRGQCTDSRGLWTCAIKEGARPALLSSDVNLGVYGWHGNTNPFVVLDIPQGWCVGSVNVTFVHPSSIPTLSLSVHSAEHLSANTDRTMFSLLSDNGRTPSMNFTKLAQGKYLRINMTSTERLYLREIEVFGTSRYTFTDTRNLHDMLTPMLTSLNFSSFVTDDSSCIYPPSAGGNPACPTTSVGSSAYSVTSTCEYTILMSIVSIRSS